MADNKNTSLLYNSWIQLMASLSAEQSHQLIQIISNYQTGTEYDVTDDTVVSIFTTMIKPELDKNEEKYQSKVENAIESAKKRATVKSESQTIASEQKRIANNRNESQAIKSESQTIASEQKRIANNRNESQAIKSESQTIASDSVNVNVNDNVNVNNNINNNINNNKREKGKRENGKPFSETALKTDDDILIKPKTDTVTNSESKTKIQDVVNDFNSICLNLPKIKTLSEQRKRVIKIRLKSYPRDKLCEAFKLANSSSFLCGDNTRSWTATFDWIMQESNLAKILDGNYENKDGTRFKQVNYAQNSRFNNFSQREKSEEEKIDLERKLLRGG